MLTKRWVLLATMLSVFFLPSLAGADHLNGNKGPGGGDGEVAAHDVEMSAQHDMIKQAITDAQMAIQGDLTTLQTAVDTLAPGEAAPPCGAAGRFVDDGVEVCDNNTGLYWVKMPDSTLRIHATAVTHCDELDLGNSQTYRLPEIQELIGLIDYGQVNLALPAGHPFMNLIGPTEWFLSSSDGAFDPPNDVWMVFIRSGQVKQTGKGSEWRTWCVRNAS